MAVIVVVAVAPIAVNTVAVVVAVAAIIVVAVAAVVVVVAADAAVLENNVVALAFAFSSFENYSGISNRLFIRKAFVLILSFSLKYMVMIWIKR